MSCFKYIVFLFLAFLSSLYGKIWTDCSEVFADSIAQTVSLPGPAEIDYKVGLGKEFREALAGRTDINWNAVADNYREWSEHTTTLSGPARMLVACVLTAVTNGMGSEWFAAHGIAEGTATNAALSAGIQAVVVGAGTSLGGNLGDIGKTFDELTSGDFVKSLASTMLTAGLNLGEAATLKEGVLKGAEKIAIQTTLEGRKVGDILVGNIVDAGSAQIAHIIGDAKAAGLNKAVGQLAHAGLGAASAAVTGGDAAAGAIGAVVSETAAEAMGKPDASHEERQKIAQKSRLIGDTVAFVAGRDVASADSAGRTAVENNYGGHPDEEAVPPVDVLLEISDKPLTEQLLTYTQASIEEGVKETQLWNETATVMAPYVATGAVTAVGFGVPLVAKTAGVLGTMATAHYFGSIAVDSGAKGLVQEAKDHPIMTTLAVMPFVPKIPKGTKGIPGLVKADIVATEATAALNAGKSVPKTIAVGASKKTWHQLDKSEKTLYQNSFLKKMLKEKKWVDSKHKIRGQKAYYCDETGLYYTKVKGEKCDFEAWTKEGKKAKHQGAIECIDGNMYEKGKRHPDSPFE